jgi:hypothetical protein
MKLLIILTVIEQALQRFQYLLLAHPEVLLLPRFGQATRLEGWIDSV